MTVERSKRRSLLALTFIAKFFTVLQNSENAGVLGEFNVNRSCTCQFQLHLISY